MALQPRDRKENPSLNSLQSTLSSKSGNQNKKLVAEQNINESLAATWSEIIPFFIPVAMVAAIIYSYYQFHNIFIFIWTLYVAIPWIDYILPVDNFNLPEVRVRIVEKDKRYLIPLYTVWTMDFILFFQMLYDISIGKIGSNNLNLFLLAISLAQIGAINATIGHELFHRKEKVHKIFGALVYAKMIYSHFFIQHIRSHHKHVATPLDPSTSRLGESLYYFYWRALPEGYVEVWNYEQNRLKQQGTDKWWQIIIYNRAITFNVAQVSYLGLVYVFLGGRALIFHFIVSIVITLMLEAINYIEHYGLQRKFIQDSDSIYESVKITHSWNAPQVLTNCVLYKLQRHSDHHANSYKPYQILDSFPESPMLPYGYSVSLLVSIFPYIWKKIIDPLAISTNKGEKITTEDKAQVERWVLAVLLTTSTFITYITFFKVGVTGALY